MKKILLFMLCWSLPQAAWAYREAEQCGAVAMQAHMYMEQRQAGKKRSAMIFSTDGTRPAKLKRLYKEIIRDAHNEELVKQRPVQRMVANSFQDKWYQICLERRPDVISGMKKKYH